MRTKVEAVVLSSTSVKVHPEGTGRAQNRGPQSISSPEAAEPPRSIWLPRMLELP